jgi:hypothetical protein
MRLPSTEGCGCHRVTEEFLRHEDAFHQNSLAWPNSITDRQGYLQHFRRMEFSVGTICHFRRELENCIKRFLVLPEHHPLLSECGLEVRQQKMPTRPMRRSLPVCSTWRRQPPSVRKKNWYVESCKRLDICLDSIFEHKF